MSSGVAPIYFIHETVIKAVSDIDYGRDLMREWSERLSLLFIFRCERGLVCCRNWRWRKWVGVNSREKNLEWKDFPLINVLF
jgi:hypothetical protein